ncbi:MAG: hypothetical protein KUG77_07240, partial [Nannocystaceae bacterium]|nr:hypothetical protein [Nannocystaceae bacterium]
MSDGSGFDPTKASEHAEPALRAIGPPTATASVSPVLFATARLHGTAARAEMSTVLSDPKRLRTPGGYGYLV